MKKILSIIVVFTMLCSFSCNFVFAEGVIEDISEISLKDEIIAEYKSKIIDYKIQETTGVARADIGENDSLAKIQTETVIALNNAGYSAYDVNSITFNEVQKKLNTNLEEAGLNPNGKYIILIEGGENQLQEGLVSPAANYSDSFTHTYNGTTYTLRWMTVFATDDPYMQKQSYKDILQDNSRTVIMNFLDAAVGVYLDSVWRPLGTVASLLGLNISNFVENTDAYCIYNAMTTWTRRYTQVMCLYYNEWRNGCCVEEVEATSYLNGWYYDTSTNSQKRMLTEYIDRVFYSDNFNDFDWRKDYAVIGYLNNWIEWDSTGDIKYSYDGNVIITHRHNF